MTKIYTIGYQSLTIEQLTEIMAEQQIDLIDVRTRPYTRKSDKYDFNRNRLGKRFGARYTWAGNILGGLSGPVPSKGIEYLLSLPSGAVLLLCMENDPAGCHRYYDIGARLQSAGREVIPLTVEEGQVKEWRAHP